MDKESLLMARDLITGALAASEINIVDKVELMRNLDTLLQEENYEHDVKVLMLTHGKEKGV